MTHYRPTATRALELLKAIHDHNRRGIQPSKADLCRERSNPGRKSDYVRLDEFTALGLVDTAVAEHDARAYAFTITDAGVTELREHGRLNDQEA